MELSALLQYENVVIQCHDEPDADAFASGFALYCYLVDHDRCPRFIYGGRNSSLKPNLLHMREFLRIPAEYATSLEEQPDLLVLVDCQYGEKNVQRFDAKEICVIDHHQVRDRSALPALYEIRENYGSCSTVLYGMLQLDGYDISRHPELQTALWYGLYMDTCQFQELWHPADKDMWDALSPDEGILDVLKNTNIVSSDLTAIGNAFASHVIDSVHHVAVTQVSTRDRNVLGIVSDTLLQVDCVDACVVFARIGDMYRFSVRSCIREIRADELVCALAEGIGSAGGHMKKAAGVIFCDALPESVVFADVLAQRIRQYFDNTDTFYAGQPLNTADFTLYRKLPVHVGMADLNEVFPLGAKVMLRTLEGDIDLTVSQHQLLMTGVNGESYPIDRKMFERNYVLTGRTYVFPDDYVPAVRDYLNGTRVNLSRLTRECVSLGSSLVYAKQLTRRTHVFTIWDPQKYIYGNPGDWLAIQKDNPDDVYIIAKDVFANTYTKEE